MRNDAEDRAAHILLARALCIDPSKVTDGDLADFRETPNSTPYETEVMRLVGAPQDLARRIIARDRRVSCTAPAETGALVASFNRGNLGDEWPEELRRMIEEKRRQLLEDRQDKDDADRLGDPQARK